MVDQLQSPLPPTLREEHLGARSAPRVLPTLIAIGIAALAAGLVVGWLLARSDGNGPSTAMVQTVDAWEAAVEGQDAGDIAALYAEDARWYDEALGDTFTGQAGVRRAWTVFSGVDEVTVDQLAVEQDTAVLRWTFVGAFDLDLTGISVLEIDGDVIVAETVYYDCAQSPVKSSCANM